MVGGSWRTSQLPRCGPLVGTTIDDHRNIALSTDQEQRKNHRHVLEPIDRHTAVEKAALATIADYVRSRKARKRFLRKKQATVKLQTAQRSRCARMLVSTLRAARALLTRSKRWTRDSQQLVEERVKEALKPISLAFELRQKVTSIYLVLGLAALLVAAAIALFDSDPFAPSVGVALCLLLLALQPTDSHSLIRRGCAAWLVMLSLLVTTSATHIALTISDYGSSDDTQERSASSTTSLTTVSCPLPPPTLLRPCESAASRELHLLLWYWSLLVALGLCGLLAIAPAFREACPSRLALSALWRAVRVFYVGTSLLQMCFDVAWHLLGDLSATHALVRLGGKDGLALLLLSFAFSHRNRRTLHARLTRELNSRRERRALDRHSTKAAGLAVAVQSGRQHWTHTTSLAALVGQKRSPFLMLDFAKRSFRALPFPKLSLEHLQSNQDTGLYQLTARAGLGMVDAFLSHSWSDSAPHKWAALSKWAKEQQASSPATELLVWLDKGVLLRTFDPPA